MQELMILKKTEALFSRVYPALVNFPKAEKYAMCADIKSAFVGIIKHISLGGKVKSKRKTYLQEADGYIQMAKILIKLSHERRYISVGFFEHIDQSLSEIERMLSGFIKSTTRV